MRNNVCRTSFISSICSFNGQAYELYPVPYNGQAPTQWEVFLVPFILVSVCFIIPDMPVIEFISRFQSNVTEEPDPGWAPLSSRPFLASSTTYSHQLLAKPYILSVINCQMRRITLLISCLKFCFNVFR